MLLPDQLAKAGTEHAHQTALFAQAALHFDQHPELRLMFAIPNGGLRSKITAANLKAEGVKSGVSDIFLPVPRGSWHGLFIEMKKPGEGPSPEQVKFIASMKLMGYGACVCVGWQQAWKTIITYLNYKNTA